MHCNGLLDQVRVYSNEIHASTDTKGECHQKDIPHNTIAPNDIDTIKTISVRTFVRSLLARKWGGRLHVPLARRREGRLLVPWVSSRPNVQ